VALASEHLDDCIYLDVVGAMGMAANAVIDHVVDFDVEDLRPDDRNAWRA
jgi:hypothetical protein